MSWKSSPKRVNVAASSELTVNSGDMCEQMSGIRRSDHHCFCVNRILPSLDTEQFENQSQLDDCDDTLNAFLMLVPCLLRRLLSPVVVILVWLRALAL